MRVPFLSLVFACVLLSACGVRPRAVVNPEPGHARRAGHAQSARSTRPTVREHVVVRGDTLYGIAFRNGLDYRDLARWNAIGAPYTIYPGQRLRLASANAPAATASSRATTAGTSAPAVRPATRPAVVASTPAATPSPTPSTSATAQAQTPPPPSAPPPASTPVTPAAPIPAATTPIVATGGERSVQGIVWRWPASGQIVSRFVPGDQTRQGIGVAGNAGQAVVAAADGEVVYSGSGLIGYGELVIIRHSDDFLSAYGHNRKRLVEEGQRVRAGQQVAEMGRTGATRDMLHFEIRRNGKPVDPLGYLPAR